MIMRKIAALSSPHSYFQCCFWLILARITLEDSEVANPFAIQTSIGDGSNGLSIISIEGFVDAHTAPQFEDAIQKSVEAGRIRIVVNCEKLSYISSAGLGVFMSFIE